MKQFIWDCTNSPFEDADTLSDIVDKAVEITPREFLLECEIDSKEILTDIIVYWSPSYTFYKSWDTYFYMWSAIEFLYQ